MAWETSRIGWESGGGGGVSYCLRGECVNGGTGRCVLCATSAV